MEIGFLDVKKGGRNRDLYIKIDSLLGWKIWIATIDLIMGPSCLKKSPQVDCVG